MKTIYTSVQQTVIALFIISASAFLSLTAKAQLNFNNPVLISGTDLEAGAVYRYSNVAPNTNGTLTIDSVIGGATLLHLDDNGMGFAGGFQPMIKSGGKGISYVVFTFRFTNATNGNPVEFSNLVTDMLDIDGNNNLNEMSDLELGGGNPNIIKKGVDLSVNISGNHIYASNAAGIEIGGIDTSATQVAYQAIQTNVSSIRVRFGVTNQSGSQATRQYSLYYRNFVFANGSLPLTLLNFDAILRTDKVNLTWITTEHKDFSHFVLQRSTDGKNFKDVMTLMTDNVTSSSVNQYNYKDDVSGMSNVVYYRLQMVDVDTKFQYSPVRMVRLNAANTVKIQTFPNPVTSELRVTIPANWQEKTTTYEIYNSNGSLVKRTQIARAPQVQQLNVQSLGSGNYIIRVTNGQEVSSSKFVKY
jgi:hypothetical protein